MCAGLRRSQQQGERRRATGIHSQLAAAAYTSNAWQAAVNGHRAELMQNGDRYCACGFLGKPLVDEYVVEINYFG